MIGYASRTGTGRNLTALHKAGWRLLVSAAGVWRTEGMAYAIDNGAWSAWTQGEPWDAGRFVALIEALGSAADWIVVPDIVQGGFESLRLSEEWLPRLSGLRLIPVQDGMTPDDLRPLVSQPDVGLFVGGSTGWKEAYLPVWGRLAAETGCYLHVGRIGSARKILLCHLANVDSFDSSGPSRYAHVLPRLDRARRQLTIPFWSPKFCTRCGFRPVSCVCDPSA